MRPQYIIACTVVTLGKSQPKNRVAVANHAEAHMHMWDAQLPDTNTDQHSAHTPRHYDFDWTLCVYEHCVELPPPNLPEPPLV